MGNSSYRVNFIQARRTKSISTARKSMLKLVKLQCLVAKCCKMRKIQLCEIRKYCINLHYAREFAPHLSRKWSKTAKWQNTPAIFDEHFSPGVNSRAEIVPSPRAYARSGAPRAVGSGQMVRKRIFCIQSVMLLYSQKYPQGIP